mmetsp:Transcript_8008/g.21230  ORF Transcript_8008/g.21230 Transcript_8008/m.21230 type:complete len:380 (-) Transcript_8008:390-1529(-)
MMFSKDHSMPNTSVSARKFLIAASRMENTQSPSQFRQRSPRFMSSWNRSLPSCFASNGMCSMIASRTRQFLSSARSTMAGRSSLARRSIPITNDTLSRREMTFKRTSGNSSFKSTSTSSTTSRTVMSTPTSGARPITFDAKAARTCCEGSVTSSRTAGRISRTTRSIPPSLFGSDLVATTSRVVSATRNAAAVRTSASPSFRSRMKAGKRSSRVATGPTASLRATSLSATMYRTRQDLSFTNMRTIGSKASVRACSPTLEHTGAACSTVRRRTESCSSSTSSRNMGTISVSASATLNCATASDSGPSAPAAARRTIGVSSRAAVWNNVMISRLRSSRSSGRFLNATAKSAHAEMREVNHSPVESLFTSGVICATCISRP